MALRQDLNVNVSMLRQWLNEKPQGWLVENSDLETWLELEKIFREAMERVIGEDDEFELSDMNRMGAERERKEAKKNLRAEQRQRLKAELKGASE